MYFKRLTPIVSNGSCSGVTIKSHLREEANVDDLRSLPSFTFEETFHTIIGNKANVYHFGQFKVESLKLTYYRKPKIYSFLKFIECLVQLATYPPCACRSPRFGSEIPVVSKRVATRRGAGSRVHDIPVGYTGVFVMMSPIA